MKVYDNWLHFQHILWVNAGSAVFYQTPKIPNKPVEIFLILITVCSFKTMS